MKYFHKNLVVFVAGRAPQGARGLKYAFRRLKHHSAQVAPRKGRVG